MAVEPATQKAPPKDFEAHVRDYSGFTKLFKYSAIVILIIALTVVMIISS